jgi:hypothetical protein
MLQKAMNPRNPMNPEKAVKKRYEAAVKPSAERVSVTVLVSEPLVRILAWL